MCNHRVLNPGLPAAQFDSFDSDEDADQGWTDHVDMPGTPHEMVRKMWILPGPTPGKVIQSTSRKSKMPGDPSGPGMAFSYAGTRDSSPWVLPGLSSPDADDPIEDEHHVIFACSGYVYARQLFPDLFSETPTVGHFLSQPNPNRVAKFLTWVGSMRLNRA